MLLVAIEAIWFLKIFRFPNFFGPSEIFFFSDFRTYFKERNYFYFADTRNPLEISSEIVLDDLRKLSVARCARVSYLTHDNKKPDIKKDLELYERLIVSEPLHASPAEHQATPDRNFPIAGWESPKLHGNFDGWIQFRKSLPNEQIIKYNRQ